MIFTDAMQIHTFIEKTKLFLFLETKLNFSPPARYFILNNLNILFSTYARTSTNEYVEISGHLNLVKSLTDDNKLPNQHS